MKPYQLFLALFMGILVCMASFLFFQSEAMLQFIWNVNTFHGFFSKFPDHLTKYDIVGSYAFAFNDFYAHLPRSVSENSMSYSFLLTCTFFIFSSGCVLIKKQTANFQVLRIAHYLILTSIVIFGLWLRLFFAYHTTANHDMVSWYIDKDILDHGHNVYGLTTRYNYSPVWFLMLKALAGVNQLFPQFPFMFIVRSFLSLTDVVSLFIVWKIAGKLNANPLKSAALFFLNPVSIIITGYHGQFDGLVVLFLLGALLVYVLYRDKGWFSGWLMVTFGLILKHEIPQQLVIFLRYVKLPWKEVLGFTFASVALFLISFVPYMREGLSGIIANVFQYGGMRENYGLIMFYERLGEQGNVYASIHKVAFISGLMMWALYYRPTNLIRGSLLGFLFFLVFTSGMSLQQLVLPVAIGAIIPSGGFYLYCIISTFVLLGDVNELKIHLFEPFSIAFVWVAAVAWFGSELKKSNMNALFHQSDHA